MKKKICILYTGGTIGMVATENGYAPKRKLSVRASVRDYRA